MFNKTDQSIFLGPYLCEQRSVAKAWLWTYHFHSNKPCTVRSRSHDEETEGQLRQREHQALFQTMHCSWHIDNNDEVLQITFTYSIIAEHSICHPGLPYPHGESQPGRLFSTDFHRAKSAALRLPSTKGPDRG